MSSTPTHYTDLYPKRGDISESNYQAFGKGEDVLSYVIRGIKAKTITAIGTCAPGSSIVQYLYSPRIHHYLGGVPKLIVGNASNKLGEFSCVYIPFASLRLFACMANKKKLDTLLKYILDLENEALAETDWCNSTDKKYVCSLLPNFFILYFGQKPPTGDITGSKAQAFGTGEDVLSYVIGGIKAKTIAAIGTCVPGSSIVQYLYAPRIHHDLGGEPNLNVGNASNKMGEFSCVYIPFVALRQFV